MKKSSFAKQFKSGTMPVEPTSPNGPIYREASSPSVKVKQKTKVKTKKRGK